MSCEINIIEKKRLVDKLAEECSENIDENRLIGVTLNYYKSMCGSCTIYIVLLVIFVICFIGISCTFIFIGT